MVVGGGIFGIFAAWDAAQRGLKVAIVEQGDWTHGASANCFRVVHGGIRYVQHADLARLRQSSHERNILLRIAPHLVRPLPVLIPTYGHGRNGKEVLAAGLLAYDVATWDRNRGIGDPSRRIPPCRLVSRGDVLRMYPDLEAGGLTGGALFHDGQMWSAARLGLAVLKSAVGAGAQAANYVAATGFLREGDRVTGITAEDRESGAAFEIRASFVVNAAGAWAEPLLERQPSMRLRSPSTFSRDAFFVLPRRLGPDVALAVKGRTRDPDAFLSREARHLFLVPWRDCTIVGVWHVVYSGSPDQVTLSEQDIREFIDEINWAYPGLNASIDEVSVAPHGLVLFGENPPGAKHLRYGKRSRIVDHAREHGIEGLVTLIGVRYTTARSEAERVIDLVARRVGRRAGRCATADVPVHGGDVGEFERYARAAMDSAPPEIGPRTLDAMIHCHGSAHEDVLALVRQDTRHASKLGKTDVIEAEVVYAVRDEMAVRLTDVVCRRTDLGAGTHPGAEALNRCGDLMAAELGWGPERRTREVAEADAEFLNPTRESRSCN